MSLLTKTISCGSLAALCLISLAAAHAEPPQGGTKKASPDKAIPRPQPIAMPPVADVEASIRRGIEFLVARQNENGSWGNPTQTKGLNIFAPVPGSHHAFRAATTALCVQALIESGSRDKSVIAALDRSEQWLLSDLPRVRRATPVAVYNVWTHAYSILALLRLEARKSPGDELRPRLQSLLKQQIELLCRYESVFGGWGYYDMEFQTKKPGTKTTSFTTATALIALLEARNAGYEVPQRFIKRAVEAILLQQKPDFSYLYSRSFRVAPMSRINRPGGSLGRSQVCNLALRLSGDKRITDQVLVDWLDRLFARNLWLDIGRKRPIPHESWFAVAGYFFYYGHYYAAGCLAQLPATLRPTYQAHLADRLLKLQEKDGSWWDFPLYDYHQQYGTAFAVMSLVRCREAP